MDSAAYVPPPTYLSEAVPGNFCGGVPTYHKRRLVGNRPPIWEGARTQAPYPLAGLRKHLTPTVACRLQGFGR